MSSFHATAATGAADQAKGRVERAKVQRYWPGKAPKWSTEEAAAAAEPPAAAAEPAATGEPEPIVLPPSAPGVEAPAIIIKRGDDPRLRRLAAAAAAAPGGRAPREAVEPAVVLRRPRARRSTEGGSGDEGEPAAPPRAAPAAAEPAPAGSSGADGSDGEDAVAARREALRARARAAEAAAAAAAAAAPDADAAGGGGSSSEYTTDDSEEEGDSGGAPLARPVFVPRGARETLPAAAAAEAEAEARAAEEAAFLERRRAQTKEMVAARLAAEAAAEAAAAAGPAGAADVDTDDDAEGADAAYDAWRTRELGRLHRDRAARLRDEREREERERWRAMSEAERAAWLAAHPPEGPAAAAARARDEGAQRRAFLQKYYHRGAFFQTAAEYKGEAAPLADEALRARDVSAPTGADAGVDRSTLPAVMQVRNFGRRGQVKWTHLKAEDTSRPDAAPLVRDAAHKGGFRGGVAGRDEARR